MISLTALPREEDQEFVYRAISHAAVTLGFDCPNANINFSTHSYEDDQIDEPVEKLYHDENTLDKVRNALISSGMTGRVADNAINEMQNAGILFRERSLD